MLQEIADMLGVSKPLDLMNISRRHCECAFHYFGNAMLQRLFFYSYAYFIFTIFYIYYFYFMPMQIKISFFHCLCVDVFFIFSALKMLYDKTLDNVDDAKMIFNEVLLSF